MRWLSERVERDARAEKEKRAERGEGGLPERAASGERKKRAV